MKEKLLTTKRMNRLDFNGYFFIFPVVLILTILVVYPLCYGFYISFFKTNLIKKWDFVGFKHYSDLLTSPDFWQQMFITLSFTICVVLGHFVIGTILALILNNEFKFRTFFRVVLLLPWLFPDSVIALLFKWIFNSVFGVFNYFLMGLHIIDNPISWLGTTKYALPVVILVCIWKGYPMIMMMIIAGLQAISVDIIEAATIDGASSWKRFKYIILPSLKPVLVITLILDTIWWFKHYTLVWVLTGGGPGNDTSLVSISIYKLAFDQFNFGKAAAMSVIVFFFCLALGILYRRLLNHEE